MLVLPILIIFSPIIFIGLLMNEKKGGRISSKEGMVKFHSFRQFVFLPSRNIAFIIIRWVKKSDFVEKSVFSSFRDISPFALIS